LVSQTSKSDDDLFCDIVSCGLLLGGNSCMNSLDFYIYTPATTDVTIRWKTLYGWIPPTQDLVYQKKWANFRKGLVAGIESLSEESPLNLMKENDESLSSNQPRSN
jgi:hypothetical protein